MVDPFKQHDDDPAGDVVEDLLITPSFLIKGRVEGKFARLSQVMERHSKRFLILSVATMVALRTGEVIHAPRVHVNLEEVVLAHELVDSASDYYQRVLSSEEKHIPIRAFYQGPVNLEIGGRIRPGAYENPKDRFFVMEACSVRGLDTSISHEFNLVSSLSYAIVNADRLSFIYDFS